ncbi:MAG: hypothetical protein K1Y36_06810 [Blastocatellia bacterium]|nr:hypothetical protein [Blastocatellia bacterium]
MVDPNIQAVDEIEQVLKEFPVGEINREATKRIEQALFKIRSADGYTLTKCGEVRVWAEIFYSRSKHKKHGGPERALHFLRCSLLSLRQALVHSA